MSDNRIGIYLDLFGGEKAQNDLRAVGKGLNDLGPASQAGARAATQSLGSMQMSAAQTAAALRSVPAQFTDIVVSLQSGQAPLTVLLQQGGQLKDMFGGVGAAARALGGYVVGLITPLTLLAGGIVALGVAYMQGSKERDAFNQSIVMSGNLAGVTAGKLADMAKSLSGQGYSQSGAADALAKLVATGKVGSEQLEKFAAVAMDLEKRAGIPIANTVENMAALGKEPVQASMRLNEQYGYLTTATLAQIKASEEEGRSAEAAAKAQDTFAKAMAGRTGELTSNLGYIERGWNAVKKAASDAWNAMLNVGRPESQEDVISKLRTQLETRKSQATTHGDDAAWQAGNAKLQTQIDNLEKALSTKNGNATQQAANQRIQNEGNAALSSVQKINDMGKSKAEQASDAISEYRVNLEKLRASLKITTDPEARKALEAQLDPGVIKSAEAALNKKYSDKGAGKGAHALQTADRRLDLSELQNAMRQEQAMIGQQQQQLELSRSAGLISLEDYYAQKRALIQKNASVDESGTQQQINRLEKEKVTGADALNVQKQIADLRGKLAVRQIQTQNELAAVDQQADQAARQHKASIEQLSTAYEAYVGLLQRRADLEVASQSMGDSRKSYEQGLSSIRENYAAQLRQMDDQKGMSAVWTPENEKYYVKKRDFLVKQLADEERLHKETYDRIGEAQGNWLTGAMRAAENYLDSSRNVAQQTADAFSNAFKGMEDALVSFATTGKLDFTSFANSIISDIVRIQIRSSMVGSNGNDGWLSSLLNTGMKYLTGGSAGSATASASTYGLTSASNYSGGGLGLKLNAKGGVYDSPSLSEYRNQVHSTPQLFAFAKGAGVFGEAGPEAIMPLTRGPDGNLGVRASGGSANVQVQVNNYGAEVRQREEKTTMPDGSEFRRIVLDIVGDSFASGTGAAYQGAKSRFGLTG